MPYALDHVASVCCVFQLVLLAPNPPTPLPNPTPLLWHAIPATAHARHKDMQVVRCLIKRLASFCHTASFVRAATACSQKERIDYVIES